MRLYRSIMLIVIPLALATACSSSREGSASRGCELSAADSVFIRDQPLFRSCAVDRAVKAVHTRVEIPTGTSLSGQTCFVAEVQFVVGTDGRPEAGTVRLIRGGGDAYGNAVLASAPGWVYTPATRGGIPVRQLVRERRVLALRVTRSDASGAMVRSSTPPCR